MSRTSPDVPGTWEHADPGIPIARPWTPQELQVKAAIPGMEYVQDRYSIGQAMIFVAREPLGPQGEMRWHLSISRPNRHPSWDDLKAARYRLLPPELTFAVLLPPPERYINVPAQDHVFHVHEVKDDREVQ